MRRFVLARAVGSARQLLALVVAVPAVAGALYLSIHQLDNPGHLNQWQVCPAPPHYILPVNLMMIHRDRPPCQLPSRFVWQIPAGVLLGLAGLGSAAVIAGPRRPRRRLPGGVSQARLARI